MNERRTGPNEGPAKRPTSRPPARRWRRSAGAPRSRAGWSWAATEAVLRSIVEAAVLLFEAEAASLALFDPARNLLVFRVAAGAQGQGVVGLEIPPDRGLRRLRLLDRAGARHLRRRP